MVYRRFTLLWGRQWAEGETAYPTERCDAGTYRHSRDTGTWRV